MWAREEVEETLSMPSLYTPILGSPAFSCEINLPQISPHPIPPYMILSQKPNRAYRKSKQRVSVTKGKRKSYILNDSLFINLMQVYKFYCTLPNKSAMKNKVQKTPQNQKPKHAKCAAVNLLAIRILKNSIMYSRFSLRFKEL